MRRILFLFIAFLLLVPATVAQEDCFGDCPDLPAAAHYGLSAAEIAAYDAPEFAELTVDPNLLHDRRYQRVNGAITVHDAPGGGALYTLDAGFNFVTTINTEGEWSEINPGEWVPSAALADSNYVVSHFTGVFLPDPLPEYPVAWMLKNVYASSAPGGPALESNELFYRYTRLTIYATVEVEGWRWYQVGPEQWIEQRNVAKVLPVARPAGVDTERWVSIDLYEQVLVVYTDDTPIFATLIASGLPRWPTEEGTFNIYYRRTREHMSWGTPGDDFYALEEVPWTMYFDEGRALHGAYWHDGFGFRRSHGCVNMSITDAHWLYRWVAEDFDTLNSPDHEVGPAVYVYSSGEYR